MTPPLPHPAGIVLARPGYYTIPGLDALGEMVDEGGDCYVEDLTTGREGYGSIFFPGITNLSNMNLDEIVFFRRKEVTVYPDDDKKPPVGEGLNKKAEITLDCVWPRDQSIGTPIKCPEKLKAMRWQDKIEENSLKFGAEFIDYRSETGSWVFKVKHFTKYTKYGLLDDSDDVSEQEKKRLRTAQAQQVAVQGGLFASKPPAFGTQTTASTGGSSFMQAANQSAPANNTGFGATQRTGEMEPAGGIGPSTTSTPAFNFGGGAGLSTGSNLLGNSTTLAKPGRFENLTICTSVSGSSLTATGNTAPRYGDSPLFWNMKESSTKREDVRKPARTKALYMYGLLSDSKSKICEGLKDDNFSFGNDMFVPRISVKKLILKKPCLDSSTPSRGTSLSGKPSNVSSLRDEGGSKGIPEHMSDTSNRGMLNARNQAPSPLQQEPMTSSQSQDDTVNISIISRDESNADDSIMDERPMTPPSPHPAGIVLTRPGYYTIPGLDVLGKMVDDGGDCYVEDLTIGCEGYGSIFFPGFTNLSNMNLDEIVFFRRKEVIVYPDDDNKPPVGEDLNKKAEITLDCVWPRDQSIGTPIKSHEKLTTMRWQDKIEEKTWTFGAEFIDYRSETGSWVFKVKHFSKYGLLDDSDEEDVSEQEKKHLRTAQAQQVAVQKYNDSMEQGKL